MILSFVKKILILIFLITSILLSTSYVNTKIINRYGFKLKDDTEVLITGSSLVTLGIDPSIINQSENVAMPAEPFVVSFFKLRDILSNGHQVKKVIMSTSIQELPGQDEIFSRNKAIVVEMFSRLSYLKKAMKLKDLKLFKVDKISFYEVLIRNRVFPNYSFIRRCFSCNKNNCSNDNLLHITGYEQGADFNQGNIGGVGFNVDRFVGRHFKDEAIDEINSQVNFGYLDSINHLCQNYDIELITVGMPVSEMLYEKIPECYKKEYSRLKTRIKEMPKTRFYDFTNVGKKNWFMDIVHLNEFGSKELTSMLNDYLILEP